MNRYYDDPAQNSISHHGILGQKWGKKNGPPYPLSSGAHSSSEKKAGWRKSLSGESSGPTVTIRKTKDAISANKANYKKKKEEKAKIKEKQRKELEKKKLSEKQLKEKSDIERIKKQISKDPMTITKNKELARKILSDDEYKRIINRMSDEQRAEELAQKKIANLANRLDSYHKYVSLGIKVINSYNAINGLLNKNKSKNNSTENNQATKERASSPKPKREKKSTTDKAMDKILDAAFKKAKETFKSNKKEFDIKEWLDENPIVVDDKPTLLLEDKKKKRS